MRFSAIFIASLLVASAYCACDSAALTQANCHKDCTDIGFTGPGVCVAPSSTDCTTGSLCNSTNSTKKSCITIGFVNSADKCVTPADKDCLNSKLTTQCSYDQSYCVAKLGFAKQANGICIAPTDCKAAGKKLCGTGKTYCLSQGYAKDPKSEDCLCDTTKNTESQNKCTVKTEQTEVKNPSNGILLCASVFSFLALLF